MRNNKLSLAKLIGIVTIVLEIAILVLLKTSFLPCLSDKAMKCHTSHDVVCFLLIGLIAFSFVDLFSNKNASACVASMLTGIIMVISIAAIPAFVIGGCIKPEMVCNTTTYPFIYMSSVILIIVHVIKGVIAFREAKESERK